MTQGYPCFGKVIWLLMARYTPDTASMEEERILLSGLVLLRCLAPDLWQEKTPDEVKNVEGEKCLSLIF